MQKSQPTFSAPVLPVAGQRVHTSSYGFQHDDGIVIALVSNEFGTHALVLMDDGSTQTCHSLRDGAGIGWHAGASPSRTWIQQRKKGGQQ